MLQIIHDLLASSDSKLSVKDITSWFVDRYGDEYDRRITPKWMGHILRVRLNLKTHKSHGVFVIPIEERPKLTWLFEKYGIVEGGTSSSILSED